MQCSRDGDGDLAAERSHGRKSRRTRAMELTALSSLTAGKTNTPWIGKLAGSQFIAVNESIRAITGFTGPNLTVSALVRSPAFKLAGLDKVGSQQQRLIAGIAGSFGRLGIDSSLPFAGLGTTRMFKGLNFGWETQLQTIAKQIGAQHYQWLKALPRFPDFSRILYPENLHGIEGVRLDDVEMIVMEDGIPLFGVPRRSIAEQLLRADSAAKRRAVLGRKWREIAEDCREVVEAYASSEVLPMQRFALSAVEALASDNPEAAQALAANLLDTILTRHLKRHRAVLVPGSKVKTPDGYEELAMREYIAMAPIWPAYQDYWASRGDPVPRTFNRNATAHTVGSQQFSRRNAVQAVMIVCSILHFLDHRFAARARAA